MLWLLARVRTSVFGTRSLHMIHRICHRLRIWNALSLFFPLAKSKRVRDSLPYRCGENTDTVYCHLGVGGEFAQLSNKHA